MIIHVDILMRKNKRMKEIFFLIILINITLVNNWTLTILTEFINSIIIIIIIIITTTTTILIIIILFQEDNIFGTNASLTYDPQIQRHTRF